MVWVEVNWQCNKIKLAVPPKIDNEALFDGCFLLLHIGVSRDIVFISRDQQLALRERKAYSLKRERLSEEQIRTTATFAVLKILSSDSYPQVRVNRKCLPMISREIFLIKKSTRYITVFHMIFTFDFFFNNQPSKNVMHLKDK